MQKLIKIVQKLTIFCFLFLNISTLIINSFPIYINLLDNKFYAREKKFLTNVILSDFH